MPALRPELFDVAMASALATSPAASLAAVLGSDGALRELGDEFDAAWRAERATAGRPGAQLRADCERIARQILASRARTLTAVWTSYPTFPTLPIFVPRLRH